MAHTKKWMPKSNRAGLAPYWPLPFWFILQQCNSSLRLDSWTCQVTRCQILTSRRQEQISRGQLAICAGKFSQHLTFYSSTCPNAPLRDSYAQFVDLDSGLINICRDMPKSMKSRLIYIFVDYPTKVATGSARDVILNQRCFCVEMHLRLNFEFRFLN